MTSKLLMAPAAGGAFSPLDLTNLIGWWDASDAGSFTYSSGSVVSQWNDLSGNGYHLTQGTVANQPTRTASLNSLDGVTFDGSNDYMQFDAGSDAIDISPWTFWCVVDLQSTVGNSGYDRVLTSRKDASSNDYDSTNAIFGYRNSPTNGVYLVAAYSSGTVSNNASGSASAMVIGSRQTGTSLYASVDGVDTSAATVTAPSNVRYLRMGATLFATLSTVTNCLRGDIFEAFICNSDVTDSAAYDYLAEKWGLS